MMKFNIIGEVKYTYEAWHMCNFCSRAFKEIDKLLDHKFEYHHDEFMGIDSALPVPVEAGTSNPPRKKSVIRNKRVAKDTCKNGEEDSCIPETAMHVEDAERDERAVAKSSKSVGRRKDARKDVEFNHNQGEQNCKKKPRLQPPAEDENEDREVHKMYKLRQKSSEAKQDQDDLYLACSYCAATFSTLESLKSHESWEVSRQKPKPTAGSPDNPEDVGRATSQSSGESSKEPSTESAPRKLAKITPLEEDLGKVKATKSVSATTVRSDTPASKRDHHSVMIPRKFAKIPSRERRSRTPMCPSEVNRTRDLSPRPAKMRASIEPPRTIRCAYCWLTFGEEEYGEHRKICSKRLRSSFTARKSTSNIDLAATVEQLTQQVEAASGGGVKQVDEEM